MKVAPLAAAPILPLRMTYFLFLVTAFIFAGGKIIQKKTRLKKVILEKSCPLILWAVGEKTRPTRFGGGIDLIDLLYTSVTVSMLLHNAAFPMTVVCLMIGNSNP